MHLLANPAATLANAFRHSACQGVRLRPLLRIGGDIRPGPSVADELSNVSGAWSFHIRARVVLFCLACSVREPSAGPRRVPGGACGGVFAGPRHAPGLERLWETGRHAGWPGETAPPPRPSPAPGSLVRGHEVFGAPADSFCKPFSLHREIQSTQGREVRTLCWPPAGGHGSPQALLSFD